MKITLQRFHSTDDFTIGKLTLDGDSYYTCEDEKREQKVMHETRIPAGTYEIKLRTFGGHHERYKAKFPFHVGMLWLQNVPKFEAILIHIGNTDADTSGCILLGMKADLIKGTISQSTIAYSKFYPKVAKEITEGRKVFIEITDEDGNS